MIRQILCWMLVSVGLINAPIWAESATPLGFFRENATTAPVSATHIPLYDTPNGNEIGYAVLCSAPLLGGWSNTVLPGGFSQQHLVFTASSDGKYAYRADMTSCVKYIETSSVSESDTVRLVAIEDMTWYLYKNDIPTLTYYAIAGEFVKILANTIEDGVWLSRHDLHAIVTPVSWSEDIVETGKAYPCLLDGYDGLQVHATPSEDSVALLTLEWQHHEIVFTGILDGNWAEADIFSRDVDETEPQEKKPLVRGWIHVVNEKGQRQIYFFATCS